jgi:predicted  nucleic acid-binding Zn-ribbon protein
MYTDTDIDSMSAMQRRNVIKRLDQLVSTLNFERSELETQLRDAKSHETALENEVKVVYGSRQQAENDLRAEIARLSHDLEESEELRS